MNPENTTFPTPFVFPSGRSCRNFEQLAHACQQEWNNARELLLDGELTQFLNEIGHSDLAQVARQAAHSADQNQGLDQLLRSFPGTELSPPVLRVEPPEIGLGSLEIGSDYSFELQITNEGMGLLHGTLTVAAGGWAMPIDLTDGLDHFQTSGTCTLTLKLRGDALQASPNPLEGRLRIESNGGSVEVVVRAEIPVKPFAEGSFAGARTPRELASKAKKDPQGASALFDDGAVARWYSQNGWPYPNGLPARGLGALQQFFEALGLTKPPRLEISKEHLSLQGQPGEELRETIELRTLDKRPIYLAAESDQPWLEIGTIETNGDLGSVPLVVVAVPGDLLPRLEAKATITANGGQRFVVHVSLDVRGYSGPTRTTPALKPSAAPDQDLPLPEKPPIPASNSSPAVPGSSNTESARTDPAGLRQFLGRLPRPVVFGLFGGLGGFLSALILGELLHPQYGLFRSTEPFEGRQGLKAVLNMSGWFMICSGAISFSLFAGQRFLSRTPLSFPPSMRALGGGCLAGLLSGALGQWIYQQQTEPGFVKEALRTVCWGLAGGLIGCGMAFSIPNLKWWRGLLSGLFGGLLSGAVFALIYSTFDHSGLRLAGRAFAFGILGFSIGLVVILVERIFRNRWLTIALGPREVHTVALGSSVVSIGSASGQVTIWVRRSPPVALRYWVAGERIYCEDVAANQTSEVQVGHRKELPQAVVEVCGSE